MDDVTAARTVDLWPDLCLFLGGSVDSFTGVLLGLIAKADPGNRAKLRGAFPREVAAWEEWQAHAPLSWGDLDRLTTARAERPWRDDFHLQCGEVMAVAAPVIPVTVYLSGEEGHEQVEAAVEALLDSAGLEVSSPRPRTAAELQEAFLDACRVIADYWSGPLGREYAVHDRVSGALHSWLCLIDGVAGASPCALNLTAAPHPDDKAFHQAEGENWAEPGTVINANVLLHEFLFGRGAWQGRPEGRPNG